MNNEADYVEVAYPDPARRHPFDEPMGRSYSMTSLMEKNQYVVYLPHSCDEWIIAAGTREEVITRVEAHIAQMVRALDEIRTHTA